MLWAMSPTPPPVLRVALICVAAFVVSNAVFYFLSGSYFESHRQIINGAMVPVYTPELSMHVRLTFVVLCAVLAVAAFAASIWTRIVGHGLPVLLAVVYLVAGFASFASDAPTVVGITLVVAGVLMPVLAWSSYDRRTRSAWSFLVAMCGAFAAVTFFGSPKLRSALDIGLWTAMILPGLNIVAVVALLVRRGDYVERDHARP